MVVLSGGGIDCMLICSCQISKPNTSQSPSKVDYQIIKVERAENFYFTWSFRGSQFSTLCQIAPCNLSKKTGA